MELANLLCRFVCYGSVQINFDKSTIVCESAEYPYYQASDIVFLRLSTESSRIHHQKSLEFRNFFDHLIFNKFSSQVTASNTTQDGMSPTYTPHPKAATTIMHGSLKPGTLAAIVVTILTVLIVGAAVFIWYKRRHNRSFMRTPQSGAESSLDSGSIVPFALPITNTSSHTGNTRCQTITDKRNISLSRPLAQRVLQNELDAGREKVVELEEQEMRLGGPASESAAMQRRHSDTVREVPDSSPQDDLAAQLQAVREEMNLIVRRIDELNADNEEVQAFGWGRAGQSEPPPDYE
ncbi:hypothetical protein R3P38DRAFT_3181833 [Favolaschia claudopus]|uniref:Uncharacterized protein n=1 Tax=Favolaschia claudopus TaxID=2862362 RepID=A0AAW0CML1_9AGAR